MEVVRYEGSCHVGVDYLRWGLAFKMSIGCQSVGRNFVFSAALFIISSPTHCPLREQAGFAKSAGDNWFCIQAGQHAIWSAHW